MNMLKPKPSPAVAIQPPSAPPEAAQGAPVNPPMFGEQSPVGGKPKQKSQQTSVLGSSLAPTAGQLGGKTLLGGAT